MAPVDGPMQDERYDYICIGGGSGGVASSVSHLRGFLLAFLEPDSPHSAVRPSTARKSLSSRLPLAWAVLA